MAQAHDADRSAEAAKRLAAAKRPVLLLGGGALGCGQGSPAHRRRARRTDTHDDGRQGRRAGEPSAVPRLSPDPARGARASAQGRRHSLRRNRTLRNRFLVIRLSFSTRTSSASTSIRGHARAAARRRDRHPRPMPSRLSPISPTRCPTPHNGKRRQTPRALIAAICANEDRKADDPLRKMLAQVLAVIREALPPETVIASDMTQIAYAANEIFPVDRAAHLAASGWLRHARLRASRRHRRQIRLSPTSRSR